MYKAEGLGMEGLTREKLEAVLYELTVFRIDRSLADLRAVIAAVVEERMADPVEMYTDLMGSSCLKAAFDHRHITEALENTVMCHCMLSIITVREDLETHTVVRVTADIAGYGTFIILEISPYDRHITTFYRMHEELLGKIQLRLVILGNDQKA